MVKGIAVLSLFLLSTTAIAQDAEKKKDKWKVADPPLKTRSVKIDVDEGTWMNLDVSPDGRTIAFDLLGDIYTMPIGGGRATLILGGNAYETLPRWSPDGRRIAFTSDRDGLENVWTMSATGRASRTRPILPGRWMSWRLARWVVVAPARPGQRRQ